MTITPSNGFDVKIEEDLQIGQLDYDVKIEEDLQIGQLDYVITKVILLT